MEIELSSLFSVKEKIKDGGTAVCGSRGALINVCAALKSSGSSGSSDFITLGWNEGRGKNSSN